MPGVWAPVSWVGRHLPEYFSYVSTSLKATELLPPPAEELSGRTDKYERYISKSLVLKHITEDSISKFVYLNDTRNMEGNCNYYPNRNPFLSEALLYIHVIQTKNNLSVFATHGKKRCSVTFCSYSVLCEGRITVCKVRWWKELTPAKCMIP
jgi:hypothetical protein